MVYGNRIGASEYKPCRDLIGEVDSSSAGNIILRIGQETRAPVGRGGEPFDPVRDTAVSGWQQTGHVVLVPDEAYELLATIARLLGVTCDSCGCYPLRQTDPVTDGTPLTDGTGPDDPRLPETRIRIGIEQAQLGLKHERQREDGGCRLVQQRLMGEIDGLKQALAAMMGESAAAAFLARAGA